MPTITLSLFNRLEYSRLVLEYLSACIGIDNYQILCQIDKSPLQSELSDLVAEFSSSLDIHTHLCSKNLGCNKAIYECLDWGFEDTEFLIHIEDDILLSKDALRYFEFCNKMFINNQRIFTIDGYNNKPSEPINEYGINLASSFKPWGWATWKDRWLEIKPKWQFSYNPIYEQGRMVFGGGGWDVCMKQYLRKDRCRVYPMLARSINIGAKNGIHTPSEEWHKAKHDVKIWANDILDLKGTGYYKI